MGILALLLVSALLPLCNLAPCAPQQNLTNLKDIILANGTYNDTTVGACLHFIGKWWKYFVETFDISFFCFVWQNRFVEDVQDLVEAGCKVRRITTKLKLKWMNTYRLFFTHGSLSTQDDFFCTVLGILKNEDNIKHKKNEFEQKILRNLAMFIKISKVRIL